MTNVQKITDSFYLTFFLVERIPRYVMFHVWSSGLEWVALPLRSCSNGLSPLGCSELCGLLISTVHFFSKILQFYILILSQPRLISANGLSFLQFSFLASASFLHQHFSTFISSNAIHHFPSFIHRIEIKECQKSSELRLTFHMKYSLQFKIFS